MQMRPTLNHELPTQNLSHEEYDKTWTLVGEPNVKNPAQKRDHDIDRPSVVTTRPRKSRQEAQGVFLREQPKIKYCLYSVGVKQRTQNHSDRVLTPPARRTTHQLNEFIS